MLTEKPVRDPKRTGVKASCGRHEDGGHQFFDGHWFSEPGTLWPVEGGGICGFLLACPGCGQVTGPRDGANWSVTGGSREDVTGLSLSPSIACGCCGWHGYLRTGVFESC